MTEMNKKRITKNRSLFSSNEVRKKEKIKNKKLYSHNNLTLIMKKNFNLNDSSKKILNLMDFIKQKNKFFIESSFDVNGTREFLASKEIAMRSIKLNDEINENNKDNTNKLGKNTLSPRKSRKSHKIKNNQSETKLIKTKKSCKSKKSPKKRKDKSFEIESKENSSKNLESSNSNNDKENNSLYDKSNNDSLSNIYKFFIDNANDSEENFEKKLKKELKKVDNLKHYKNRKKSLSKKDMEYKRPKRMNSVNLNKRKDIKDSFLFSEINKNKMKNDDLELSSIEDDKIDVGVKNKIKNPIKRVYV